MTRDVDSEAAATDPEAADPEAADPGDEAAPEAAADPGAGAAPWHGRPWVLVAALAVAAAAIAAFAVTYVRLAQSNSASDARATALAAARSFAAEISSYDYQHLDGDFGTVLAHSADPFKSQFTKASKDLAPLIQKYQATSTGSVVAAGVSDATTDSATVVVFVDQTVRNTNSPAPRVDRNRLRLTLKHSGGGWLVDRVEIL